MSEANLQSLIHPKSILVVTNLTDLQLLLPEAVSQASAIGARVFLLHVVPPEAYVPVRSGAYPFVPRETIFSDAEGVLRNVAQQLNEKGVECSYEVRRWFVVEKIAAFIREKKIERVILGTSSRGRVGKLLLGSVAEELIRTVDVPVCTIGPHLRPQVNPGSSRLILALSLRHESDLSFQFAEDLAFRLEAELTILNVVEQKRLDPYLELDARAKIEELVHRAPVVRKEPRIRVRFGDPAEEILSEASGLRPDSIILGAVPASTAAATFRTGVVYKVIADASCPVFTLRAGPNLSGADHELFVSATKN